MSGADAIVFTGGIGEHATPVRAAILSHLEFLNVPRAMVIPADEERMMAMQTIACLAS